MSLRAASKVEIIKFKNNIDIPVGIELFPGHCSEQEFGISIIEDRLGILNVYNNISHLINNGEVPSICNYPSFGIERFLITRPDQIHIRSSGDFLIFHGSIPYYSDLYKTLSFHELSLMYQVNLPLDNNIITGAWSRSGFVFFVHKNNKNGLNIIDVLHKSYLNKKLTVYLTPKKEFTKQSLIIMDISNIPSSYIDRSARSDKISITNFIISKSKERGLLND